MVKFFILIPSYNRPSLVIHTVSSVLEQTYPQYKILIIDNGSEKPVQKVLNPLIEPRIKLVRNEKNVRYLDEDMIMEYMAGCSHFLFLGDDDALVPSALEIVASVFEQYRQIEFLGVGLAYFNHTINEPNDSIALASYTGQLKDFDANTHALSYCNFWGIGAKQIYPKFPRGHPSGTFISTELIARTRRHQQRLLIEHFGDVGYLGAALNTGKTYYLDLPLSIVGTGIERDSDAGRGG